MNKQSKTIKGKKEFGQHNICIGREAGWDLTTESYQFIFTVELGYIPGAYSEFRTTMTPKEFKTLTEVITRASTNKRDFFPRLGKKKK